VRMLGTGNRVVLLNCDALVICTGNSIKRGHVLGTCTGTTVSVSRFVSTVCQFCYDRDKCTDDFRCRSFELEQNWLLNDQGQTICNLFRVWVLHNSFVHVGVANFLKKSEAPSNKCLFLLHIYVQL
jgi:hypothetical protein